MRLVQSWIVGGLERLCRVTRFLEWVPGWNRIYRCQFAQWSNRLDARWGTEKWPVHAGPDEEGWDEWEAWFETVGDQEIATGHWHAW
jgi:hypothetical protein